MLIQQQQMELRQSAKGTINPNGGFNFNTTRISNQNANNISNNTVPSGFINAPNAHQNSLVSPKSGLFSQGPSSVL